MAEVRIKDIDEHEIDTILAEDIDFEGHLTFKKPLMIKGKFKGEIKSTSSLYIGEKAFVEATTEAGIISSKGRHKGDIHGHARVELFSTAQVDGDITTPDFIMESGCKFNGYCNMGGGSRREAGKPAQGPQPAQAAQAAPQPQAPQQRLAQPPGPTSGNMQQGQQKPPVPPQGQGSPQK
jgi:cytoskeletal protein CcmA (bactofilin family)